MWPRTRNGEDVGAVVVGEGVVVRLHDALAVAPGDADRCAAPVLEDRCAVQKQLIALPGARERTVKSLTLCAPYLCANTHWWPRSAAAEPAAFLLWPWQGSERNLEAALFLRLQTTEQTQVGKTSWKCGGTRLGWLAEHLIQAS